MAAPAIANRRRTAPQSCARVDWAHPLARGLIGCGAGAVEWARKTLPGVQPSTPQNHATGQTGFALDGTGASGGVVYRLRDATTSNQMTLSVELLCPAAGVVGGAIGWGDGAGGQGAFLGLGNLGGNLDGDGLEIIGGESGVSWRNSGFQVVAGWNRIGYTLDRTANVSAFYANGRQVATGGAAYNVITAGSYITYGGEGSGSRRRNGVHGVWHVHNRMLNAGEMRLLHADPFCMLVT